MEHVIAHVVSDLHLEFPALREKIPPFPRRKGNILILPGDIGIPRCDGALKDFLGRASGEYELVLYVAGNHEFYGGEYGDVKRQLTEIAESFPNVVYCDKKSYLWKGIRFLGTTLWSQVPDNVADLVGMHLPDYRKIMMGDRRLLVSDTNSFHRVELAWLEQQLEKAKMANEPVVIITHHAPLLEGTSPPQYEGSPTNHAFCTDLKRLLIDPVKFWISGHTHYSSFFEFGGTTSISNQAGYSDERVGPSRFDPELVRCCELCVAHFE